MSRRRRTSELLRLALTVSCLACVLAWWAGCGTPEQRYKLMSFLIDGVPNPNAPQGVDKSGKPIFYMEHKPYQEERCVECHGQVGQFDMSLSGYHRVSTEVCMKCHEEQVSLHPYMHGPVASKACLWCHDPHDSRYPHLLQEEPRRLCAQCHEPALLEPSVPEHADDTFSCIECHSGHGGLNPFFLIERPAPAEDESEAVADDEQVDADESGTEQDATTPPADEPPPADESPDQALLLTPDRHVLNPDLPGSPVEFIVLCGWLEPERGAW